jgi:hypothetical protein
MSTENNQEEFMIIWEAPKIEPPEFRLYYDEHGAVVCYTGDKSITGNYIVIDALTFAQARPDVRVINGKDNDSGHPNRNDNGNDNVKDNGKSNVLL